VTGAVNGWASRAFNDMWRVAPDRSYGVVDEEGRIAPSRRGGYCRL